MNDWMDADTRAEKAHKLYQRGRWVEAAAELRAAIDANPVNASWHFNLGLTLEALEDYAAAAEAYREAVTIDSSDIETLNRLGVNLTRIGQYADSLEFFEKIQKIDAGHEPCYCNRIVTYTELGQHDEAEVMFYMARQIEEECPLCFYNIGTSFFVRGEYDRAIDCWLQTLKIDPTHHQAHSRVADAYWEKGELEKAREHYLAELQNSKGDSDALIDLGEVLMEMDNLDEAEEAFRQAIKESPENPAAYFCMGDLAMKRNELNTAECCYRKVLSLDRDYKGIHAKLARMLLRTGSLQQASKHLMIELERCENSPQELQEIGELLIEARLSGKAHTVLSKLVELVPNDPHARHNLAVSCFMQENFDDGILHCRKALKLKPDYSLALYNLALAHYHKGQNSRARRYIIKAMQITPDDENVKKLGQQLGMNKFWHKLRMNLATGKRKKR